MTVLAQQKIKLTATRGKERGREWVFWADVATAGKGPGNDIVLDEDTVSREHFEIVRDGKGWLCRDLRSTNGTFLDGAEIQSAYLRSGSVVSAGAVQLRFAPVVEKMELSPVAKFGPLEAAGAGRDALAALEACSAANVALLIEGEPGTGKELAARTVHERSRRGGPLVAVDCRKPPAGAEQELFGTRPALERAHGGTLLLWEPGELPAETQGKLLRTLIEREPRRGGRRLDARVISTSARPVADEVGRGRFREELAARLAGVVVRLLPLRERAEDITALAQTFAAQAGRTVGAPELAWLAAHDWPGNLDELRTVARRELPSADAAQPTFDAGASFREHKERWTDAFERRYLTWLLARADGNISRAAREADMDRKYLHKLLRKHGLS